jgi:putative transposase
MKVYQAYRYELKPSNHQKTLLKQHAGTARFTYNWGLAKRIAEYQQTKKSTNAIAQHKELNALKEKEFPWMYEVSKCAPQEALRNLDRAFKNFFERLEKGEKPGFPRFKKKGDGDSFRLTGSIRIYQKAVKLPRLGKIRLKENTNKFKGRILSATVTLEADRWFVSLQVVCERNDPEPVKGETVGVDVGINSFAVMSDERKVENPKFLDKSLKKIIQKSKALSRKQKGSNNREKAKLRLSRAYRKIKNQRKDFLHKLSSELAKTKPVIVIEDLNVRGMVRNRKLSRRILDSGWSEFRRLLEYKCEWYGSRLMIADKFYPSTKMCSECGRVKDVMSLSEREYICESCGMRMDRDLNASKNLNKLSTASSAGCEACGERLCGGTLRKTRRTTSTRSKKQEASPFDNK